MQFSEQRFLGSLSLSEISQKGEKEELHERDIGDRTGSSTQPCSVISHCTQEDRP